jgi:hypothetical protein
MMIAATTPSCRTNRQQQYIRGTATTTGFRTVRRRFSPSRCFPHGRVGLDILEAVIIHHAQLAFVKRAGHGQGNLCLGFDHAGAHFGNARHHFLFGGDGGRAADFGLRLRDKFVRFRLLGLKFGADVAATSTSAMSMDRISNAVLLSSDLPKTVFNAVGIIEHRLVGFRRADGRDMPSPRAR